MSVSDEQAYRGFDDQLVEALANRVAALLRAELEAIAEGLADGHVDGRPLTVGEVAQRFGVARSTVYSHWREWGGYKLGTGPGATIRFHQNSLPDRAADAKTAEPAASKPRRRRRRRPATLESHPRFVLSTAAGALEIEALNPAARPR